ncbi:hypothetical protein HK102_005927 [Quaeritorhiza haematococci]|nr:hypothetical protein HK102_005927 [Quaeritorhiza haematococci]
MALVRRSTTSSLSSWFSPTQAAQLAVKACRLSVKELYIASHFTLHSIQIFHDALRTYKKRATRDLPCHIIVRITKGLLSYPHTTIQRARLSQQWMMAAPVPRKARVTKAKFLVNMEELLRMEREAARLNPKGVGEEGYVVPEELGGEKEHVLDGEWVHWVDDEDSPLSDMSGKVILYLHGGAFFCCSTQTHRPLLCQIARNTGARVFAVNYRLAPECPFPAGLHDAFAAYLYLIDPLHPAFHSSSSFFTTNYPIHKPISPSDIIIMGDSAGGGLSMSLLVYLKNFLTIPNDRGGSTPMIPLPGAACLFSPWVDLTCSSDSWESNDDTDYLPSRKGKESYLCDMYSDEGSANPVIWYAYGKKCVPRKYVVESEDHKEQERAQPNIEGNGDTRGATSMQPVPLERNDSGVFWDGSSIKEKQRWEPEIPEEVLESFTHEETEVYKFLKHPLISPAFGDLEGMPPILIQAGQAEMLMDETLLLARKLSHYNPQLSSLGYMRHELYTDGPHVFHVFGWLAIAKAAHKNLTDFLRSVGEVKPMEGGGGRDGHRQKLRRFEGGNAGVDEGLMVVDFVKRPGYSEPPHIMAPPPPEADASVIESQIDIKDGVSALLLSDFASSSSTSSQFNLATLSSSPETEDEPAFISPGYTTLDKKHPKRQDSGVGDLADFAAQKWACESAATSVLPPPKPKSNPRAKSSFSFATSWLWGSEKSETKQEREGGRREDDDQESQAMMGWRDHTFGIWGP